MICNSTTTKTSKHHSCSLNHKHTGNLISFLTWLSATRKLQSISTSAKIFQIHLPTLTQIVTQVCAKACGRSGQIAVKFRIFCWRNGRIVLKIARNHEPIAAGSHEVSGSIPLISTKTKSHSVRNGFLFWLGIRGARSAVVRPNAFLRRKSAAFSACNAENIRKCNRHGASEACGVSRLSFHFPFSKISRISFVMRPDPDLTQTGAKTRWIYWDLFDKTARIYYFSIVFRIF